MSEWQPIETAPKDGVPKLLAFPAIGGWLEGAWRGSWSFVEDEWIIHTPYSSEDGRNICVSGLPAPTHWMPLKEPPK